MGRKMKPDAPEAFRVVLKDDSGIVYGPYATLAAARGSATRECGPTYWRSEEIPHKIQRSSQVWEDVE